MKIVKKEFYLNISLSLILKGHNRKDHTIKRINIYKKDHRKGKISIYTRTHKNLVIKNNSK